MPSTSAAVSPHSRSTATQASAASDAWERSVLCGVKPVVAAPANATWSFIGLRDEITIDVAPVRRNAGTGTPAPVDPVELDPLADHDRVVRRVDDRRREPQADLLVELDRRPPGTASSSRPLRPEDPGGGRVSEVDRARTGDLGGHDVASTSTVGRSAEVDGGTCRSPRSG